MRYFKISVVLLEILCISFINLSTQRNVFSWEKLHILFKLQERKFASLFHWCAKFSFSFFSMQFFFTFFAFSELFLWYFLCRGQLSLYYVIEGRDSHRNQNWLYRKKYILLLFFLMLRDFDCCVNVTRLPIKLTHKSRQ